MFAVYESNREGAPSRQCVGSQGWGAAPAALAPKALPDFVFWSRSRAATKFSKSMAVTTPNTICLFLDFALLWSEEGMWQRGFKVASRWSRSDTALPTPRHCWRPSPKLLPSGPSPDKEGS